MLCSFFLLFKTLRRKATQYSTSRTCEVLSAIADDDSSTGFPPHNSTGHQTWLEYLLYSLICNLSSSHTNFFAFSMSFSCFLCRVVRITVPNIFCVWKTFSHNPACQCGPLINFIYLPLFGGSLKTIIVWTRKAIRLLTFQQEIGC